MKLIPSTYSGFPLARYIVGTTLLVTVFVGGMLSAPLVVGTDALPKKQTIADSVATGSGLSSDDWTFTRPFDGPLLASLPEDTSNDDARELVHDALKTDFVAKKYILANRYPDLRDAELLMTYLALRVGLSIPILDSGKKMRGKMKPLILDAGGNCLHHGLRASFVLDAFGITARLVTFSTPPHIMGHAVADVYDPANRLAALVDTNKKFLFLLRDADASFFETVLAVRDRQQREALLDSMLVVELPPDVRYFTPSEGHLAAWRSGGKTPVGLDQVRTRMAEGRISKTREAFLDGYDRLFTQRTRDGKHWWLRIHDMSTWVDGYKTGLQGRTVTDNSQINAIIGSIRAEMNVAANE